MNVDNEPLRIWINVMEQWKALILWAYNEIIYKMKMHSTETYYKLGSAIKCHTKR